MKYIGTEKQLKELGFTKITREYCELNYLEELEPYVGCWHILSAVGRRGQDYYLIIGSIEKTLFILSTEADGSGTIGKLGDEVYHLISKGLVNP